MNLQSISAGRSSYVIQRSLLSRHTFCNQKRISTDQTATKCTASTSQSAATDTNSPNRSLKCLPHIMYSLDVRDIDVEELSELLQEIPPTGMLLRGQEEVGTSGSGEKYQQKVQRSLKHSLAVVAAFAPAESLPSYQPPQLDPGVHGKEGDSTWSWVTARRRRKRVRKLVGFARAIGDSSLVATLHDVVVHPELRGLGLGRTLLRRIVSQLGNKGIFDVGLTAPEPVNDFFRNCAFGPDTEDSIFMAFKGLEYIQPRRGGNVESMIVGLGDKEGLGA